jgi:anti-sigma28 factor (negative regulator of flagellin synthesis)
MSDLSQPSTESAVITESTDISSNWGVGSNARERITNPALQNIRSLPRVRKKKILEVRQQLTEGTYDIDKRLNVVLDRLLEDLVA